MPLPLTVSCSSKIQIGFTFLVPAYPGCPGKEAVKWLLLLLSLQNVLFYSLFFVGLLSVGCQPTLSVDGVCSHAQGIYSM